MDNYRNGLEKFNRSSPQKKSAVCAVITTFRPDDGFPERVARIRAQVGLTVIVDDGGCPENVGRLKQWFGDDRGIRVHHNSENRGIAASLNTGVAIASHAGYNWILTLDDDTRVAPEMVETLISWWTRLAGEAARPLAVMGMSARDPYHGQVDNRRDVNRQGFAEKRHLATSGCLMSLEAYRAIGPFREEFFIDWVDYDYCLRARRQGFLVIKLSQVGMIHPVGRITEHRFGWFKMQTGNYPPFRRYYWYRNSLILAREYLFIDPIFSTALLAKQILTVFLILLCEKNRKEKLRFILHGIVDGWRRKLGKI